MDYVVRQSNEPLFPDVLWSRPENKAQAGKFVIIGGSAHGFHSVFEAYQTALEVGVGEVQLILPDSLESAAKDIFANAAYVGSTPSGSFSKQDFEKILAILERSDGLIVSGDLENNSETALLFEDLVQNSSLPIAISQPATEIFENSFASLTKRAGAVMCIDFKTLQKLPAISDLEITFTSTMNQDVFTENLHILSQELQASLIIDFRNNFYVVHNGQVCIANKPEKSSEIGTATKAGIFLTQLPETPFESLVSSVAING